MTAIARTGRNEDAIRPLQQAAELGVATGNRQGSRFFLAMAHHRLGRPQEARRFLAQAVSGMTGNRRFNRSLSLFRREAEALIGPPPD